MRLKNWLPMLLLGYWRNQARIQKNSWLQPNNFDGRRKLETLQAFRSTLSAELIEFKACHSIWEPYILHLLIPAFWWFPTYFNGRIIWIHTSYPLSREPTMKRKGKCDIFQTIVRLCFMLQYDFFILQLHGNISLSFVQLNVLLL